jgi:aminoglycoside phosphotransferase (APT) family kinase protein
MTALPAPELVVTHGDWRVENLSVVDSRIVAVYDWDSVAVMDELVAVGAAALTFPIDWERDQARRFPVPTEIAAFAGEYERARSRRFTTTERERLSASMAASLAYGARCEHADRARPPVGDDSQRGLLAKLGPALLRNGLSALTE